MAVRIRMKQMGRTHRHYYRIVAIDSRQPRDGKVIEELGTYDPHVDEDPVWHLIRTAWGSVADFAVVPLQDVLRLGTEARMNVPGVPSGNWRWRCTEEMMRSDVWHQLGDLTELYYRQPGPDKRQ